MIQHVMAFFFQTMATTLLCSAHNRTKRKKMCSLSASCLGHRCRSAHGSPVNSIHLLCAYVLIVLVLYHSITVDHCHHPVLGPGSDTRPYLPVTNSPHCMPSSISSVFFTPVSASSHMRTLIPSSSSSFASSSYAASSSSSSSTSHCSTVCTCIWKSGKQTATCDHRSLLSVPQGLAPTTQVIDLSGNSLNQLPPNVFLDRGLVNLQRIFMVNCQLGKCTINFVFF